MRTYSRRFMRSTRLTLCAVLMGVALAPAAFTQQQGGNFTLHPTVVPGGGGASATCTKRIEGSIGQTSLETSSASGFAAEPGFWPNSLTCPLALAPTTQFFTTAGGPGSLNVIASSSCGWTVLVHANWITLTSSDTGTGNAEVTFEVRENFTGSPRQALINVNGFAQVVVQDAGLGDDCNYSINPQFQSFSASGGSGVISVIAEERCAWQAVSSQSWITIISTNVGIGNGTVVFCVEANPGASGRSGKVTMAGKIFLVKQKGS